MTSKIKFTKQHPRDLDIQSMQREIEDKAVALDKDGNIILDRDIHCRSLYVDGDSLFIGGIKVRSPNPGDDAGYWKYAREEKQIQFTESAVPSDHASEHEVGGGDLVNHDDLTGFVADEHIPLAGVTLDVQQHLSIYDPSPARSSESNIYGGILSLAVGQSLDSVPTDIPVTKGIGKMMVVINAGSDVSGSITVTGNTIDRNTQAKTLGDTETITVDAVSTDNSTTDANGNPQHLFTGAYITSKWFYGTVTLSTTDLTLTDVDVYHVSFEQFGDNPGITLDIFDAYLITTNVSAEFDAYLYAVEITGGKCNISILGALHVGAGGETAIANKYERLRSGDIAKTLDGTTDGIWIDVHYSNSPAYVEDVTIKIWYTQSQALTY